MHIQNYFTELDAAKIQRTLDQITQAYWAAGLPGFPELVALGPRGRAAMGMAAPNMGGMVPNMPGMLPFRPVSFTVFSSIL